MDKKSETCKLQESRKIFISLDKKFQSWSCSFPVPLCARCWADLLLYYTLYFQLFLLSNSATPNIQIYISRLFGFVKKWYNYWNIFYSVKKISTIRLQFIWELDDLYFVPRRTLSLGECPSIERLQQFVLFKDFKNFFKKVTQNIFNIWLESWKCE